MNNGAPAKVHQRRQQKRSPSFRSRVAALFAQVRIFSAAWWAEFQTRLESFRNSDALRRIGSSVANFFKAAARPSLTPRLRFDSSDSKTNIDSPTRSASAQSKSRGHLFAYLFLAATAACLLIILALIKQLGEVKDTLARSQRQTAATNAKLIQAQTELRRAEESKHTSQDSKPKRSTLALDVRDIQLVRQYIKVPPQSAGKPTIQLGERIPNAGSIPLPESLTGKIPALQGASFLLDQDGSIVLIGKGSNQADAIIPTQF